jgi:UDP-glucose 4-epimerase
MAERSSLEGIVKKKRVLITGGLGLVGGRLAVNLNRAGYEIILGTRKKIPRPNWLLEAEIVQTDWTNFKSLIKICHNIDIVIHAAGINAKDCEADPLAAFRFNELATYSLLEASIRAGVKRFFYLSTAHVYSSPLVGIFSEETQPSNTHPYAASKLAGENSVLNANHKANMECIVLRVSNAVGAPMNLEANCWMLLANDLCKQVVMNNSLILHGNPMQERNFIPMEQLCDVIKILLHHNFNKIKKPIFNIGSPCSMKIIDLVKLIQNQAVEIFGTSPKIIINTQLDLNNKLIFCTKKIENEGILINQEMSGEIKDLLHFCLKNFSSNK